MKAPAIGQMSLTMSRMLLYCPRGCRTTFIHRLIAVFKADKTRESTLISLNRPYERVANIMGMKVNAVRQLIHRADTCPRSTTERPLPKNFDNFCVGAIRRFIHKKITDKEHITLSTSFTQLKSDCIIPEQTSMTAFWQLLHSMGFKYKLSKRKMYVRKESRDVVSRRISALRALRRHRNEGTVVVYLDETWFTTRMGHNKEWVDTTEDVTSSTYSRQVPPGEGERYVVIAGGTRGGFVEGSYLCYPAKSSLGDYHGEMNSTLFQQWLTTRLLPALPEPSVLVLDNAPYHRQLTEDSQCPTTATNKAELMKWLEKRNIDIPNGATRCQLLNLCRQHRPQPQYAIENIVQEWGHQVVWLPPGHPELNAIEQVWGCMKHHVRSSLRRFTRTDLNTRIEEARQLATARVWSAAVTRSEQFENDYWKSDNIHEPVDPIIINITSDDSDVEDDDVFLTSDDE